MRQPGPQQAHAYLYCQLVNVSFPSTAIHSPSANVQPSPREWAPRPVVVLPDPVLLRTLNLLLMGTLTPANGDPSSAHAVQICHDNRFFKSCFEGILRDTFLFLTISNPLTFLLTLQGLEVFIRH